MRLECFCTCALLLVLGAGCGAGMPSGAKEPEPAEAQAAPGTESEATASSLAQKAPEKASTAPPSGTPAADEGGAKPQSATVVSEPLTGGQLSQQQIREIVVKNGDLFNECYTIGAGKSRQFVATVTVKATIGPTGKVNETQIIKSTAKNNKVDTCVADAFKKIKFPAPQGANTSVITFPMEFEGAEEVKP